MVMQIIGNIMVGVIVGGTVLAGIIAILAFIKDRTKKVTCLRFLVQVISVVAIFSSLLLLAKWPSIVLGSIIVMTIFFGRFFCGWICPFGLYMDVIALFRKHLKIKYLNLSDRTNRYLHKLRYLIVAFILVLALGVIVIDLEALNSFLFFHGPFKDLTIVFLGPLEPLIKPGTGLIEFSEFSISYPYIRGIMNYTNGIFGMILVLFFIFVTLASTFVVRRFWCRFCPTAVSIGVINRFTVFRWIPLLHVTKVEEKCPKCGVCKRACPVQATDVYEEKGGKIKTSMCMLCMRCVEMCPYEDCLKVNMGNKTIFKSRNWLEPSPIK
jgi:ferredoxin-type protein NapH